jgi:hypothetical protein
MAKKKEDDAPVAEATTCTCPKDWTGEGHAPECPKRAEVIGA